MKSRYINMEEQNQELRTIIEEFRINQDPSKLDRFKLDTHPTPDNKWSYDRNAWDRAMLILELFNENTAADKPLIKWILDEEIKGQELEIPYYALDVIAYLLYKHMDNEDIYQLFMSKFAYGNVFHLDVELIFGHDREEMKAYLKDSQKSNPLNKDILATISSYEQNPDAKFKSREEYVNYYENRKIKHIRNDIEASKKYMQTGDY